MQKSKYVLASDRDRQWGLTVTTVGYEEIAPGESYPTKGHADGYYFHLDEGRILNEFQLLYNPEGYGTFRSAHLKETDLRPGDMFLLFPREWHTYHPDPEKGWKSYWIGFKGEDMDNKEKYGFLSRNKPIYHIGYSHEIEQLYMTAFKVAREEDAYYQQLLTGIVNHLVGLMYSLERNIMFTEKQSYIDVIKQSRTLIYENIESNLTIRQIANEFGVSYSNFRKHFKEYAGLSPSKYQQELKLLRAKELLSSTNLSIKEIAYRLNFTTPDYFSAKYKKAMGIKPTDVRSKK